MARLAEVSTRRAALLRKRHRVKAKSGTRAEVHGSMPVSKGGAKRSKSGFDVIVGYRDASGNFVIEKIAKSFAMSKTQIAQTAGLNPSVIYKAARLRSPKNQNRVQEMLEVINRVSEWAGGKDQAMAWYRAEPIPAFGGRTAESLVKDGKAAAVRDYLDSIAMGGFA
ncbi:MAG: MbcA/ParS/Xre antitoxin family protein [Rhizomicrobium sp.]